MDTPKRIDPSLTRDQVIAQLGCSHSELGRLIRERRAPMPVRLDGAILWFADEIAEAAPSVARILQRRRA